MRIYNYESYSYVHIVEIPKFEINKFDIATCQQPRETLSAFYNRQSIKPTVLANCGFFGLSNGLPCFGLIDENKTLANDGQRVWGIGVVGDNDISYGNMTEKKWRDWVSAYPTLIKDSKAVAINDAKELNYKARRTALGINDSTVFIICVENPGMNFAQIQALGIKLGCTELIGLDGGASSQLYVNGNKIHKDAVARPVDSVVAIYTNNNIQQPIQPTIVSEPKIIYRVQAGAYSDPKYAAAFRDRIRALPDERNCNYKSAYVRIVAGFHKVQIGAYSVKSNAERVVADLKAKGISSYITTD